MVIGRLCVCKANIVFQLVLVTVVIDRELTLGLFYLISDIKFTFLLIHDCRFVYRLLLIVDLSLTTVLLIIQSLF